MVLEFWMLHTSSPNMHRCHCLTSVLSGRRSQSRGYLCSILLRTTICRLTSFSVMILSWLISLSSEKYKATLFGACQLCRHTWQNCHIRHWSILLSSPHNVGIDCRIKYPTFSKFYPFSNICKYVHWPDAGIFIYLAPSTCLGMAIWESCGGCGWWWRSSSDLDYMFCGRTCECAAV